MVYLLCYWRVFGLEITFIFFQGEMSHCIYFTISFSLSLLQGSYPARLKKVLIVTAPLWFKAPFKILRLFVREKLRDRVMGFKPFILLFEHPLSTFEAVNTRV